MRRYVGTSRPLYRLVAEELRARIESGALSPGSKLPSEHALCDEHDVSQITVRRSLRELEHQGFVYSRHGVGWFVSEGTLLPNDGPAEAGSDVTWVLPSLDRLSTEVAQCLAMELETEGAPLHLDFTGGDVERQSAALARWQRRAARPGDGCRALLLTPPGDASQVLEDLAPTLHTLGQPAALLLARESAGDSGWPTVAVDESLCVQRLTQHLLHLGHRDVAYLGDEPTGARGRQHYWGFTTAVWEAGLELPLDWIMTAPLWLDAARGRASAQGQHLREVMRRADHPTAVVCSSDVYAAEVLRLLAAEGLRCPADVAVVGLGDDALSAYLPVPLTTLRYDVAELQRAAVRLALDLLAGRQPSTVLVSGTVEVRASCGAKS